MSRVQIYFVIHKSLDFEKIYTKQTVNWESVVTEPAQRVHGIFIQEVVISLRLLQVDGETAFWNTTDKASDFHRPRRRLHGADFTDVFTSEQLHVLREAGGSQPLAGLSDFDLCKQSSGEGGGGGHCLI